MKQLIEAFIGKEVKIHSIIGTVRGILKELSDNAVRVETKSGAQIINIDYVYAVSEVRSK